MAKWIFLEDYKLKHTLDGMINTDFIVRVELRAEYSQLVIFFGAEGHADPHILTFKTAELSEEAYKNLKNEFKNNRLPINNVL